MQVMIAKPAWPAVCKVSPPVIVVTACSERTALPPPRMWCTRLRQAGCTQHPRCTFPLGIVCLSLKPGQRAQLLTVRFHAAMLR